MGPTAPPGGGLALIVDDSPEDRAAIRRHLAQDAAAGYRFREAASGAEGLAACRDEPPTCLLLDYDLPGSNGLEFLDELGGGGGAVPFAVVMLTGRGNERTAVDALKRGAQDYLVKGQFTPGVLRQTVADAIEKVASRRELAAQREELERQHAELDGLYREAREADRRKDEFLAMLAHELRNPLAPIRNALHLMGLPAAEGHEAERAMAQQQVGHLARLVDDLLDVSRITRGAIELHAEPVELGTAVARAVAAKRHHLEERGHALAIALPGGPIWVDADPTRLNQILTNLLANAAKYTDPGGRIELAVERDEAGITLEVRDNGVGIPADLLPRVFDLFVQADRSSDWSQGGLGIGLTLVRSLAELHGGGVTAHSDGAGRGSRFVLRLPARPGPPPEVLVPAPAPEAPRARSLRVLVVDDNVRGAESLAAVLRVWGHDVRVAHDGPAGLEAVPGCRPEVVLLDIGLPGMDGYEVARALRGRPEHAGTLLVAMTGYAQEEDRRRSREAGFDLHLAKPLDLDDLEELLAAPAGGRAIALPPGP